MGKKRMVDRTKSKFGPQDDETITQVVAAEGALTALAVSLDLDPLRLAGMLLITYRYRRTTHLREAFEEGTDHAMPLARQQVEEMLARRNGKPDDA